MRKALIIFILLSLVMWSGVAYFDLAVSPQQSTHLAVANLNGNDADAAHVRVYESAQDSLTFICFVMQVVATTIFIVAIMARVRIRMLLNRSPIGQAPRLQG